MKSGAYIMQIESNRLDRNGLLRDESLFHVANGYIGMRGNFEEGYPAGFQTIRGTYINAFYDLENIHYGEKFKGFPETKQKILNIFDTQSVEIFVEGERFSLFEGEILSFRRVLRMDRGYAEREIHWRSKKGIELRLSFRRMASFVLLPLIIMEITVCPINFSGEIAIRSTQSGNVMNFFDNSDPRVASVSEKNLFLEACSNLKGGISLITARAARSGLRVAAAVQHRFSKEGEVSHQFGKEGAMTVYTGRVAAGEKVTLEKYCVFCDSRRYEDCRSSAISIINEALERPASYWYETQKRYLDQFWLRAKVSIEGDADVQEALNYNSYQLLQSAGRDRFSNIAAKGLSGEGYEGHYFWDTEIYIFPFFLLTDPAQAKNLLDFRYACLDKARSHARLLGHQKGALYPWRTITGDECSPYFPSGSAQYHINGAIAYAFISYYLATGDRGFMEEKGAEVVFETARLWLDAGHFDKAGLFRIDCVTGPDEYTCIVNNNYYTNAMAKYNLEWAVKLYFLLEEEGRISEVRDKIKLDDGELLQFRRAGEAMLLPYDEELKINAQDDTFLRKKVWDFANTPAEKYPLLLHYHPLHIYRHQVCKQADTVLAHYLLEDYAEPLTIKNSYCYYEGITTHDSSLSSCVFGIMAAKTGDLKKSYKYFMETVRMDLDDLHNNTKDGIHTANMGGTYMAVVFGFAGLRIKADGLHFSPRLPQEWLAYSFDIHFRGRRIKVKMGQDGSRFKLLEGEALTIFVDGKAQVVES